MSDVLDRLRVQRSLTRPMLAVPPVTEMQALLDDAIAEIERLRAALEQIVEHCANDGYGNPIVDNRTVDRCEETALLALDRTP